MADRAYDRGKPPNRYQPTDLYPMGPFPFVPTPPNPTWFEHDRLIRFRTFTYRANNGDDSPLGETTVTRYSFGWDDLSPRPRFRPSLRPNNTNDIVTPPPPVPPPSFPPITAEEVRRFVRTVRRYPTTNDDTVQRPVTVTTWVADEDNKRLYQTRKRYNRDDWTFTPVQSFTWVDADQYRRRVGPRAYTRNDENVLTGFTVGVVHIDVDTGVRKKKTGTRVTNDDVVRPVPVPVFWLGEDTNYRPRIARVVRGLNDTVELFPVPPAPAPVPVVQPVVGLLMTATQPAGGSPTPVAPLILGA